MKFAMQIQLTLNRNCEARYMLSTNNKRNYECDNSFHSVIIHQFYCKICVSIYHAPVYMYTGSHSDLNYFRFGCVKKGECKSPNFFNERNCKKGPNSLISNSGLNRVINLFTHSLILHCPLTIFWPPLYEMN